MRKLSAGLSVLCFIVSIFLVSCDLNNDSGTKKRSGDIVYTESGVITYSELEGGSYGIITETEKSLYSVDLERRYKIEGMKVNITYKISDENVTAGLPWKTVIELESIMADTEKIYTDTGMTSYSSLEGGSYGFITDSEKSLYPVNLANEYKTDGLRFVIQYKMLEDVINYNLPWTGVIEIQSITADTAVCGKANNKTAPLYGKPYAEYPNTVIVVFFDCIDAAEETARLMNLYGFTAKSVYTAALGGFCADLSADMINSIRNETSVKFCEYDQPVSACK